MKKVLFLFVLMCLLPSLKIFAQDSRQVELILPEDGSIVPQSRTVFSWKPLLNVTSYDFFLWKADTLVPGEDDTTHAGLYIFFKVATVQGTSIEINNLAKDDIYYWTVAPENGDTLQNRIVWTFGTFADSTREWRIYSPEMNGTYAGHVDLMFAWLQGTYYSGIIYSARFLNKTDDTVIQRLLTTQPGVTPRVQYALPDGEYELTLGVLLIAGVRSQSVLFKVDTPTGNLHTTSPPNEFSLSQNYPNPFNPSTTIAYSVPVLSHVTITIYDHTGRTIDTIVDKMHQAGNYEVVWRPRKRASGLYVYTIQANGFVQVRKMVYLK